MEKSNKIEVVGAVTGNKKESIEGKIPPTIRQIIIETDGNSITLTKAEVSGNIELTAILQNLISYINRVK